MTIQSAQLIYERWWLGKYCRPANMTNHPFKKVVSVELVGPPSFFCGDVWLHFEDGTRNSVYCCGKFKPRKQDVEVRTE